MRSIVSEWSIAVYNRVIRFFGTDVLLTAYRAVRIRRQDPGIKFKVQDPGGADYRF